MGKDGINRTEEGAFKTSDKIWEPDRNTDFFPGKIGAAKTDPSREKTQIEPIMTTF